jgi:peptidyl-prolyl cis-trans isomerase-like 6
MAFIDDDFLGGLEWFLNWATENYDYDDFRTIPLYQTLAAEQYVDHLNSKKVGQFIKCYDVWVH